MKLLIGTIAAVILSFVSAGDYEKEGGVLVLGQDNFDAAINEFDYVLAEFYAPWCGHCKSLAPEYEKAAGALAEHSNIALAKIDATEHGDLAKKYGVRGYPTLKWFKKDPENALDYGGGRKEPEISQWVLKKTGPAATNLDSAAAAAEFKEANEVAVIGYFAEKDSADFMATADSFDDVVFGLVKDAETAKSLEMEDGNIVLFKHFDEGKNVYEDGDLKQFIKDNSLAYVTEFSDKTAPKIFGGEIQKHALLFSAKSGSDHDEIHAAFTASAKKFRGKALFVFIDCDKADNGRILEFFGLKEENCPDVRMIEMGKSMKKFKQENEGLTEEHFDEFANGVLDGSITRHLMSEEIPADNSAPVTVVVGKNFDDIVLDESKHVLVEFYAPWCGHCKQLAPTWDKLGEHFADREDVVIAKSDATANEFADVEVQGFPTIKFFPKGGEGAVDYNGKRDLESFIKFVENDGVAPEDDDEEDEDEEDLDYDEEEEEEDEGHDEL